MIEKHPIRVLLVEDSASDLKLVQEFFASSPEAEFELEHVDRLATAKKRLGETTFDAILLDLGLPDSQGVETFVQLHRQQPGVPVVVLTGLDDHATEERTMRSGAEDYLPKHEIKARLLRNSVRFAVIRSEVRRTEEAEQRAAEQTREMDGISRLAAPAGTSVTARMYSGSPLCEHAPGEFRAAVAEYFDLLEAAFEARLFKTPNDCSERLRGLGLQLGFLRAGPRDVVEIHTVALKKRMADAPGPKARAYLEEGRITVLELMGHLTGYYRGFYATTKGRDLRL